MHIGPPESSVLRSMYEDELKEKLALKTKLEDILGDLEVECDVSKDRTWSDQFQCGVHGTTFRDKKATYICPVGEFANELRKKYK